MRGTLPRLAGTGCWVVFFADDLVFILDGLELQVFDEGRVLLRDGRESEVRGENGWVVCVPVGGIHSSLRLCLPFLRRPRATPGHSHLRGPLPT